MTRGWLRCQLEQRTAGHSAHAGRDVGRSYNLVQAFGIIFCNNDSSPAGGGVHILNVHGGEGSVGRSRMLYEAEEYYWELDLFVALDGSRPP